MNSRDTHTHLDAHFVEQTKSFGKEDNLVGTLTRSHQRGANPFCVLLLNAGVIGRAGPHRMNVRLARALAEDGLDSFRFDLAGLGDSARSSSDLPYEQQAVHDVREAMDHVHAQTGATDFILIGFCSGADHGYSVALQDERLKALIMFDPFPYPTVLTHLVRIAVRIQQDGPLSVVQAWLQHRLARRNIPSQTGAPAGSSRPLVSSRMTPPKHVYAQALQSLQSRGVGLYMIYSGSGLYWYNHQLQFRFGFWRWPSLWRIQCDYLRVVDHVVGERRGQELLIRRMRQWIANHVTGRNSA